MSATRRRAKAIKRRQNVDRLSRCDGTCHDRDEDCRRCERMVDGEKYLRIVACNGCVFT